MKRVVVLGGTGFFGSAIVEKLRGFDPVVASRSRGAVRIDAENPSGLHPGDLVIDAAGPFQKRTSRLIDAAIATGFDVIDVSDSPQYTSMIYKREAEIGRAGIRVLTACSALSTVSAAVLTSSGVERPLRLSAYLVPASRYTANPATMASVLAGLIGERRSFVFPPPLGRRSGVTVRSVDSVTLAVPKAEFVVDAGMNTLFQAVARSPRMRRLIERFESIALPIARSVGRREGVLAYEIESERRIQHQMFIGVKSYMLAVLPAVLAARAIVADRLPRRGLIPPSEHVDPLELFEAARAEGIELL